PQNRLQLTVDMVAPCCIQSQTMASSSSVSGRDPAMAAPRLMSVDDYFKTPETLNPMELVYGAVRVADSPQPRHQAAVVQLFRALDAHVRAHDLGEMWLAPLDVVLNEKRALI